MEDVKHISPPYPVKECNGRSPPNGVDNGSSFSVRMSRFFGVTSPGHGCFFDVIVIELDDGKILSGTPYILW